MKILIEMPLEHHRKLMAKCSESDKEYAILNSGILIPSSSKDPKPRTVVIFCEPEQVKLIIDLATRVYPAAVSEIKEYTDKSP